MSSGLLQVFWTIVFIFIFIFSSFRSICPPAFFRCFELLSSFLFSYSHRFGRYVLRPSSGVLNYCLHLYFHILIVSADMFSGLLRVFRTIVFIFIFIFTSFRPICFPAFFGCFELLSSSLFSYSHRFGRYVLRPSSGVLDYCLHLYFYILIVSADMFPGLLQVFWTIVFIFIFIFTSFLPICFPAFFGCFEQLSSSLFLYSHRFCRYVPRSSSGFLDYCLYLYFYIHIVSTDMFSGLLQVFRTIVFIFIFIFTSFLPICPPVFFRFFGLLSSSSFLYSYRFGRYVFRPSSGVSDYYLHLYFYIHIFSADVTKRIVLKP